MVANVIRYRVRSAVREVGKVLGVPETVLDRVSKIRPMCGAVDPSALAAAGLDPEHPAYQKLIRLASELRPIELLPDPPLRPWPRFSGFPRAGTPSRTPASTTGVVSWIALTVP